MTAPITTAPTAASIARSSFVPDGTSTGSGRVSRSRCRSVSSVAARARTVAASAAIRAMTMAPPPISPATLYSRQLTTVPIAAKKVPTPKVHRSRTVREVLASRRHWVVSLGFR